MSIDDQNQDDEDEATCLTINTDYLISCIEMNLAQEYKVINFDFYNDWINGLIYIPRFMRYVRKKKRFLGITIARAKVKGCMDNTKIFAKTRRYTQLCSIGYKKQSGIGSREMFSKTQANLKNRLQIIKSNNLHKRRGLTQEKIFGKENGGICHEKETMYGQFVYYLKPCEWLKKGTPVNRKVNLYATDLVLLGSLNECDLNGIPQAFKHLSSSSYIMPTNLVLTNMEENGQLYAYGDKGTICSTINQTNPNATLESLTDGIHVVDPNGDNPLASELKFYSGGSSNYDVLYDDPSDTIALTEAAGISWNYSGPGQGDIVKKKLYYPGGHFLGISCINSQTNIKSCINLERICELGTSMSQRKEDVRAVRDENGETVLEYMYSIPTGLISGDDIIDDEFRIMFATMNKGRLIATKLNPETGYKTYDFMYSHPVNFGGELSKYTGHNTPYNEKARNVRDESDALAKYGIEDASTRPDYDPNESAYSYKRTIEFASIDYYMFRLGLTNNDLKPKNMKHLRKFATEKDGYKYLPQYENSFYFYFGTRDGSTALDEFNKQFFSECENSKLMSKEASLSVYTIGEYSFCDGKMDVLPTTVNTDGELHYKLEYGKHVVVGSGNTNPEIGVWDDENNIEGFRLPYGDYTLTVIDEEGLELVTKFNVGKNVFKGNFLSYNFNVPDNVLSRNGNNMNMYYGGYINITDILIDAPQRNNVTDIKILAVAEGGDPHLATESAACPSNNYSEINFYLASANTAYDIYVKFKYGNDCDDVYLYATSVNLLNSSSIDLTIGPVLKTSYRSLNETGMTDDWWRLYDNGSSDSEEKWNIRKSIVKPNPTTAETFSSNVEAVNGIKALFGFPQNEYEDGIYPYLATTEYDDTIPAGYSLDDEATYHELYSVPDFYNFKEQYNAMAYNGVTVAGVFAAKVTGGTDMAKNISLEGVAGLRAGEGCLFKPLPDGDIIPAIYYSAGTQHIVCFGDSNDVSEYNEGIVYPTIKYPVIKKPFLVNANYFILRNKGIAETELDDGTEWATVITEYVGGKCEARVENGLTYNKYYGGDLSMPMVTDDESESGTFCLRLGNGDPQGAAYSDLYGVTQTSSALNKTFISGWTDEEVDDLSYSVQEGAPFYSDGTSFSAYKTGAYTSYDKTGTYQNVADSVDLSIGYTFYDEVFYAKNSTTTYFEFQGDSDKDAKYYAVPLTALSDVIIKDNSRTGYIFTQANAVEGSLQTYYILGYYTDKAKYDATGKDCIVQIYDPENNLAERRPRAKIAFRKYAENGDNGSEAIEYEVHKLKGVGSNVQDNEIEEIVRKVKSSFDGKVDFYRKRIPVEASKKRYENANNSWTSVITPLLSPSNEIALGGHPTSFNSNRDIVVIGRKDIVGDGSGTASVFVVYMYPREKTDINKASDVLSVFIDDRMTSEITVGSVGGTYSGRAEVSAESTELEPSLEADWCRIVSSSQTGTDAGKKIYEFTLEVDPNSTNEERRADAIFSVSIGSGNSRRDYNQVIRIRQTNASYVPPPTSGTSA